MRQSGLDKTSVGLLIGESLFTIGKLLGDPDTADSVATVQPAHKALKAAQTATIEIADDLAMAEGGVQAVMTIAHRSFTTLWLETKTVTGNGREAHPLMTRLFPNGLTAAKELVTDKVPAELERLAAAIKDDTDAVKLLPLVRGLLEVEKTFAKPLGHLRSIQLADDKVQAQRNKARDGYVEARDVLFGTLTTRFPRQADYVNSFYRKHAAPKAKPAEAPPATGATAPAAPTAG